MLHSNFDLRLDFDLFIMHFNADLKQKIRKDKRLILKDHNKPTMHYLIVLCQKFFTLLFMLHGTALIRGKKLFIQQFSTPFKTNVSSN